VSNNVSLSLKAAVSLAAAQQPLSVTQQQQTAVLDFVGRRLEQLLSDAGVSAEAGATGACGGGKVALACIPIQHIESAAVLQLVLLGPASHSAWCAQPAP
jgi:hypothetical protein